MGTKSLYPQAATKARESEGKSIAEWREITKGWHPGNKYLVTISRERSRQQRQEAARTFLEEPSAFTEFLALVLLLSNEALDRLIESFTE